MVGTVTVVLAPIPVSAVLFTAQQRLREMRTEEEAAARNAELLEEIERLGEHAWAGVYRMKGSWATAIAIAPEAGFTLHMGSSRCEYGRRYVGFGKVLADEGSLVKVEIELQESDDASRRWFGLEDALYFVPWGDLQFAVPERCMESFCAQVANDYDLPHFPFRYTGTLSELSRHAGELVSSTIARPECPPGKPRVPIEFQHLIPDDPIYCRLVSLLEIRRRPEQGGTNGVRAYDAVYSIDAGADDGLAIGTHLLVIGVPQGRPIDGCVEHLERKTGRVQLPAYKDDRALAEELVGLRATTRFERVRAR